MSLTLSCLALALFSSAHADKKPTEYARPELLVEAADLPNLKPADGRRLRVIDARGKGKYGDDHIPDAAVVDPTGWARAFAADQDPAKWTALLAPLGVAPEDTVVIYDDDLNRSSARIWYILRYWGYHDVRVLNGGWNAWRAADGKVQKGGATVEAIKDLKLKPETERLTTKDQLLDALKTKPPQLVDARSEGEYCGTEETAKRNGSIPGALHLDWTDTIDQKTGKFKSADELAKRFADAGIDPAKPAITYCQSGGRAAVLAFTLELMGGKDVRNYYRSWAEWGNDPDTPIVKPKPNK